MRSIGLSIPKLDELLAAGRAEFDPAKRKAIYDELQRVTLDEVPMVGLAWRSQGYGMTRAGARFSEHAGRADLLFRHHVRADQHRLTVAFLLKRIATSLGLIWLVASIVFLASAWCPATRPRCCCRRAASPPIRRPSRPCASNSA